MPLVVYEHLVSRTSPFHPSNSRPPQPFADAVEQQLNVQRISLEDTDQDAPKWWETTDLTSFKAVNNELERVDEELAGFETLEVLDLHSNAIRSPLPASFGTMIALTSLNLSNNKLAEWPLEIMALVQLRELDLSHNQLSRLWPISWPKDLRTRLKGVGRPRKPAEAIPNGDADASFDSVSSQSTAPDQNAGESFCKFA